MRTILTVLTVASLICTAGCKKGEEGGKDEKKGGTEASGGGDGEKKAIDWTKQPLKTVKDTVDGIAFSVDLPDGLNREVKKGDDTFPGYVTWTAKGNFFEAPGFTVQPVLSFPESLERAAESTMTLPEQRVTHKEALPGGGYLLVISDVSKEFLDVTATRKNAAGKPVRFSVSERRSKGIPNFEAEQAWMIKVAKTFLLP
jgi:hypothetical protein